LLRFFFYVIFAVKIMTNESNTSGLLRGIGLLAAISIIIGNVIGTGVFLKARVMTCNVGDGTWVIIAWIAAGILSLAGALTYAELSAMMPEAGGEYNFLRKAYGKVWSFLYGWMQIFIAKTGSQAAVAVGFAIFLNDLIGGTLKETIFKVGSFEINKAQLIGVSMIVIFTIINCLSVSVSGQIATVLTFVKIGLIVIVGVGAFALASGDFGHISMMNQDGVCEGVNESAKYGSANYTFLGGFAAAMLGALWGYDGWNNLSLVAGEVKNPSRNIPLALIGGTIAIIILYVVANIAYFYVLTPTEIASVAKDSSVAKVVATKFLGATAVTLMTAGLMLSSIGTLHTSILTGSRVPYAMAKDGTFFESFGKLSQGSRVPYIALIVQGIWASILALSGSFDTLTDYVIFGSWIFYALATASVFVFRIKMPNAERPYKAFGYPIVPILFLFVAGWLLVTTLLNNPSQSFIGLGLIALGLPVYYYLSSKGESTGE
jgi:APA family basic amino acid/polyamine antiporter